MKKRIVSFTMALVMIMTLIPALTITTSANTFTPITGWDMMEKLGIGINISNTLEAFPHWDMDSILRSGFETCWGEPMIEQWHFQAIALKGFDSVRIPVAWGVHMDSRGRISDERMSRVQEVVDWALDAGLYVILNTHHEEELYELIFGGAIGSSTFNRAERMLANIWTQIAERFKDYPETLIFEVMNEPHSKSSGGLPHIVVTKENSDRINRMNLAALNAIRATGGYNDKRVVGLTTPGGYPYGIPNYEHPDDPYTMLCVAFYAGHTDAYDYIIQAVKSGIPVFIEETATYRPGFAGGAGVLSLNEALEFIRTIYAGFAELNIPIMWWNQSKTEFGVWNLFSRHTGEWVNREQLNALFAVYGKAPGPSMTPPPPPPPALPFILSGPFNDSEFTYWRDIPVRELEAAERMVVEFRGTLTGGYTFTRFGDDWVQFNVGDPRITEERGRLIFDMRGLTGATLGFAVWGAGNSSNITRIYLDTWAGSALTTADALTVLRAATGSMTLTDEQKARYGISGAPTTADALRILRAAIG
jgi:endoglucanase